MTRKTFVAALTATAMMAGAVGSAAADEWDTIRIGVEGAYPPFSQVDSSGALSGFDIDIAHALCDEIGAECTMVQQDWDGIIPALLARRYDAIVASMSITEERAKRVDFTEKYYQTPAKFAAPKDAEVEISREGLEGKTVGVQRATIHDNFISEEFGDTVDIRRYATQDEAYMDALAGRVDLLLADSVTMAVGFLETEEGESWEFVGPDFTDPQYFGEGVGIAVRPGEDALREKFNDAIAAILADGRYEEIQNRYFDFNVYGEPYGE